MAQTIRNAPRWQRVILVALLLAALFAAALFGTRAYRSYALLRTMHEDGASDVTAIRGWMSLRQVARRYHVPETALVEQLALPADTPHDAPLRAVARRNDRPMQAFMQDVQRAVQTVRGSAPPQPPQPPAPPGRERPP